MASGLSFSLGAKPSASAAPAVTNGVHKQRSTSGRKRSHAALDDDSDNEDVPAKQVVTHFGSQGAVNAHAPKEESGPLVIKAQANRDWREAAEAKKRAKYGIPQSSEHDAKAKEEAIRKFEEARKPIWGLNVKKSSEDKHEEVTEEERRVAGQEAQGQNADQQGKDVSEDTEVERKPRTDDERAMDALLGIKQQSDRVISAVTEEEAFQQDFKTAPPQASLDEYAAMPVEEFGAALLRGMGWKEGHGIGNESGKKIQKAKMPERRPALLGIGAKEDAAVKEEIGAWGRGAKKRSDIIYNPIVMRNKQTGEELTEQEMNERLEEQKIKDREADLEAIAAARKSKHRDHRDHDRRDDRRHRGETSDEEHERRKRERRRERDRDDRDYDRRERRHSKDRDGRRDRDKDDRRDRDRHRDKDDRERSHKRSHRHDDKDYKRSRDDYEDSRSRRR